MQEEIMVETLPETLYWHSLYFTQQSEAVQAQQMIVRHYDQRCLIHPQGDEYEVSFSTDYEFDEVFRVQLALQLFDLSPTATFFNETEDRESPNITIFHIIAAVILTILLIPFALGFVCICLPMHIARWMAEGPQQDQAHQEVRQMFAQGEK